MNLNDWTINVDNVSSIPDLSANPHFFIFDAVCVMCHEILSTKEKIPC